MAAQLRFSPPIPSDSVNLAVKRRILAGNPHPSLNLRSSSASTTFPLLRSRSSNYNLSHGGGANDLPPGGSSGCGGGQGGDRNEPEREGDGLIDLFLSGWRSRVSADPQFPFKVLMEEIVGVTAMVLGDMASRPNFGLDELEIVFSTLVVGSIVNFVVMYLLAPTSAAVGFKPSAIPSFMFEQGNFSPLARAGAFVSKGAAFAAVGFASGLAGTAISNGLIAVRKRMDPEFRTLNDPPPTVMNALTWALHMGLSSNFRYQTVNGVEFVMARALPPAGFKASVVVLRCLNNVLGGMSFVVLARLTGAQKGSK